MITTNKPSISRKNILNSFYKQYILNLDIIQLEDI